MSAAANQARKKEVYTATIEPLRELKTYILSTAGNFQTQTQTKSGEALETRSVQILEFVASTRLEAPNSWKAQGI